MRKPFRCLAIDMGAGSIRILVGSVGDSGIGLSEIHRFKNEIKEIDGHDRWDIEYILKEIIIGCKHAINQYGSEIQSFGVDSWGVDFVMLGKDGNLLEIPIAYRDARTVGMQELWEKTMSRTDTFTHSGINFYIFNTLLQLFSIKNESILKHTSRILFIPNYIYYALSGDAVNELTISSTSQMLNVHSREWDAKILKHLNISEKVLGTIVEPGKVLKLVKHPELLGADIMAVSVCSHDTASAVAAIPASESGFAFISTGTWCIVGVESDKPALSETALNYGFTNERGYGNTYRVLKNILGLWLVQGLQKSFDHCYSFAELENMAEEAKDSGLYIDPEDESFFNPDNMKQAFDAYFEKTGQTKPASPGEYIKCAYNSLCGSFKKHIDLLEGMLGKKLEVIHLIGGGSQSDYLCRETARICGKKVIAGPVEGAGIGNVMVQAIAMGYIKDLKEGRELVRKSFACKEYEDSL